MNTNKIVAMLLCVCMVAALAAWGVKQSEYKLGMGVVVNMDSSAETNAQVDATVAAVVTDGVVDTEQTFKTKMELGSDHGMAGNPYSTDNNGDGEVLEWYEQSAAFSNYAVGKTADEVANNAR